MAAAERAERAEFENVLDQLEVWHRGRGPGDDDAARRAEEPANAERG